MRLEKNSPSIGPAQKKISANAPSEGKDTALSHRGSRSRSTFLCPARAVDWRIFLDSLFSDIDSLELYAGVHMQVFDAHRLLARRFPFAIYYKVEDDICLVLRMLDCRQDRERTKDALK